MKHHAYFSSQSLSPVYPATVSSSEVVPGMSRHGLIPVLFLFFWNEIGRMIRSIQICSTPEASTGWLTFLGAPACFTAWFLMAWKQGLFI